MLSTCQPRQRWLSGIGIAGELRYPFRLRGSATSAGSDGLFYPLPIPCPIHLASADATSVRRWGGFVGTPMRRICSSASSHNPCPWHATDTSLAGFRRLRCVSVSSSFSLFITVADHSFFRSRFLRISPFASMPTLSSERIRLHLGLDCRYLASHSVYTPLFYLELC